MTGSSEKLTICVLNRDVPGAIVALPAHPGCKPTHPMTGRRPIFLIGFMGAGKTTLGKALADRLAGITFVDLDEMIEQRAGMSVRRIFELHGEEEFRRMEREMLADTLSMTDIIIGCGGGTPCRPGNMELMNTAGTTVMLEASRDALKRRLLDAQEQRPLLAGLSPDGVASLIDSLMEQRRQFYSLASLTFPSDLLESEEEIEQSCRDFCRLLRLPYPQSTTTITSSTKEK